MSEDTFLLRELFRETHVVFLSEREIAQRCGISEKFVRKSIEHDVNAGMLVESRTNSSFHLTFRGLEALKL